MLIMSLRDLSPAREAAAFSEINCSDARFMIASMRLKCTYSRVGRRWMRLRTGCGKYFHIARNNVFHSAGWRLDSRLDEI